MKTVSDANRNVAKCFEKTSFGKVFLPYLPAEGSYDRKSTKDLGTIVLCGKNHILSRCDRWGSWEEHDKAIPS